MQLTEADLLNRFRAKVFKTLSDPVRVNILEFLRGDEKCVCEIIPYTGVSQPLVSRHLKILKECGIVKGRKEGVKRLYSITDKRIFNTLDAITPEIVADLSKHILEQVVAAS